MTQDILYCVRWEHSSPLHGKRHSSPNFQPTCIVAKQLPISELLLQSSKLEKGRRLSWPVHIIAVNQGLVG